MYMNIVLLSNSIQKTIYICMNELGIILKIVHNVFSFCIGSTFFQQGANAKYDFSRNELVMTKNSLKYNKKLF